MQTTNVFDRTLNAIARKIKLIVSYGGTSSGKTIAAMQALYLLACKKKNLQIFFFAQTVPKLKNTLKEDFKRNIVTPEMMRANMHDGNIYIIPETNSQIVFLSADEPDKFIGVRSDYILFDEINTYRQGKEIFKNLFSRCRGVVIATFNPASKFWIAGSKKDKDAVNYMAQDYCEVIHSTYLDNPYAPKSTIDNVKALAENDANYRKVYLLGEWGAMEGVVFKFKEHWNYFNEIPTEWDARYYAGDFGFTNDPSTLVEVYLDKARKKLYVVEHLYKTGMLNGDIAKVIQDKLGNVQVVFDSAEPKSISELRINHKIQALSAVKGPDSIKNGINLLKGYEILVWHKSANLITELFDYAYAQDKSGDYLNTPIDASNHIIDPLRYIALKYRL